MNSNKGYDDGLGWDQKRERASVQGLVEDIAKQGSERIVWNELFLAARWLSGSWLLRFGGVSYFPFFRRNLGFPQLPGCVWRPGLVHYFANA